MKNILVISTSLRTKSNSEALAEAFAKGAVDAGHHADIISLSGKTINFCKGCLACQKIRRCVIQDDAIEIAEKMAAADVVVFATPIYYYEMSGQMKTLLDRMNPLFDTDYRFRDVYLLAAAADEEESAVEGAVHGLEGWIECFPETTLRGVIFGAGVNEPGEMAGKAVLETAYKAGKSV